MITQKRGDDTAKAQAMLDRYMEKLHNIVRKGYFETAEKAKKHEIGGVLE